MLSGATCLVSNGNNISSRASPTMKARQILKETNDLGQYWYVVSRALLLMTSKADKLPLETELVARDNNTILALKHGDQTLSRLTQLIIVVHLIFTVVYIKMILTHSVLRASSSHLTCTMLAQGIIIK